jgi:hypothetical protein
VVFGELKAPPREYDGNFRDASSKIENELEYGDENKLIVDRDF